MKNIELDQVKCSYCDVKNHCQECEKDIRETALLEAKIRIREAVLEAYENGIVNSIEEEIAIIEDTIDEMNGREEE